MATSEVQICNRGLQKIGQASITSLEANTVAARECNLLYEDLRDATLRKYDWNFARKRASIAADVDAPVFGRGYAFSLPADCLKVLPPDPQCPEDWRDWIIEGRKILTDDAGPLNLRYTKKVTAPNDMDPAYREVLSCTIAVELCDKLTNSNVKKSQAQEFLEIALADARKANAFENLSIKPPEDEWILARR